jgi:hypothetical protein
MRTCGGPPGRVVGALLAALSIGAPLRAQDPAKTTEALPIEEPIRLDGHLDEPAWVLAAPATGFVQREPATGQPASEDTEVRVLYTPTVLYVGIDAHDRQPELVIAKEMQRDEPLWRDDAVDILLDTFDDDRNAYLFETNPNGARTDALITDEGRSFNLQWDGVWDVAARRTPTGWCAEVAIPFSTIRFDPAAKSWGFNVLRYIRRRAEQAFWAPILLDADVKRVSLYGSLTGIEGARPGLNLNVKPFAVGTSRARAAAPSGDANDLEVGLDVKWGFRRSSSLDLTVNTDFAETEVDALQVNLTRFPLFFPEKRYFFLENAGIFDFGTREATTTDAPLMKLFFSRRIGLGPNGEEVPIDWGVRTTGRAGAWSFGLLDVQSDATVIGSTSVPRDNWATARVTRNFGQRSSVGAIFTQRHSSGNTNRAWGADLSFKPTPKLTLAGYAAGSDNTQPGGASDWAAGGAAIFTGTEWMAHAGFDRIGEEFDPEAGFLLRRGVDRFVGRVAWEPRPALRRVMNLHFEIDSRTYTDLSGGVQSERHRQGERGVPLRGRQLREARRAVRDRLRRRDPDGRVPLRRGRRALPDPQQPPGVGRGCRGGRGLLRRHAPQQQLHAEAAAEPLRAVGERVAGGRRAAAGGRLHGERAAAALRLRAHAAAADQRLPAVQRPERPAVPERPLQLDLSPRVGRVPRLQPALGRERLHRARRLAAAGQAHVPVPEVAGPMGARA